MKENYRIGEMVTVMEGRYGFKEREVSHFPNPLSGPIIALYDTFCVVQLRSSCVAPFYNEITKGIR